MEVPFEHLPVSLETSNAKALNTKLASLYHSTVAELKTDVTFEESVQVEYQ